MNKKLKIYSTWFVVVLIFLLVTSTVHYDSYSWMQGGHDTLEFVDEAPEFFTRDTLEGGSVTTKYLPTISYEVYVAPKDARHQKILLSSAKKPYVDKVEKQTYKVTMQKVRLETPASKTKVGLKAVLLIVSAIVIMIVTIWILCIVYKLVRRIRRGEIFVAQVSKYMETTGILLTVLYLFQWLVSYVFTKYCIQHIQLTDYYVVYKNDTNSMYIITGLALMVISQIILMGKDLKDEQELTI